MTYLDLVKNMSDIPIRLITCATTGVHDDDQIIALCLGNLLGSPQTLMVKDVPLDKLEASYPYHHITQDMYNAVAQADPAVMYRSLQSLATTNVIFTYNVPFMKKMLSRLVHNETAQTVDLCDIAPLYQWIRSGQIFSDNTPHTYEQILKEESRWQKNRAPGIRTILKEIRSNWQENESKTTPENMIAALQSVFQWFGQQQVHSSSDSSESWGIP